MNTRGIPPMMHNHVLGEGKEGTPVLGRGGGGGGWRILLSGLMEGGEGYPCPGQGRGREGKGRREGRGTPVLAGGGERRGERAYSHQAKV